jgi:HNH endonuclease/NUMOD4 motif
VKTSIQCPKINTLSHLEESAESQSLPQNLQLLKPMAKKEDGLRKWKKISGWEKYQISDDGLVMRDGKERKTYTNHDGYKAFGVKNKGKSAILLLHREIAKAFLPERNGDQVLHVNDNKEDNSLENLKWGTHQENMKDRDLNGRTAKGERQFKSKLKDYQILEIRQSKESGNVLGRKYGVTRTTINRVRRCDGWKHIMERGNDS